VSAEPPPGELIPGPGPNRPPSLEGQATSRKPGT